MSFYLSIAKEKQDDNWHESQLDYVPFGIKTLKVEVKGDYSGKLRLRPKRSSPVGGEKMAHEDEGEPPQFLVSWGGGHEDYYELEYPKKRFAHFLLYHAGNKLGDHNLTIQASGEDGEQASLPVHLTHPTDYGEPQPAEKLVQPHWRETNPGLNGACDITLHGELTPHYVARWWPHTRVSYTNAPPPRVRLRHRRLVKGNNGDVQVFASPTGSGDETLLATISGSIGYPLYDTRMVVPELYNFGRQLWALRVWFFWLDLDICRQDLGRYWPRERAELEQAWRGITHQARGGLAKRDWHQEHEIPDAERVDILFDKNLKPLYAATDLHWRELWGEYRPQNPGDPLQAQIMNTKLTELLQNRRDTWNVIKGWGSVIISHFANDDPPYKPHLRVKDELQGRVSWAADPIDMESHSPSFLNVELTHRLTSTDVTDG